jgi:hypothetical protein
VDDDGRPVGVFGEPVDPSNTVAVGATADGLGVVAADEADLVDAGATLARVAFERLADVKDVLGGLPGRIDDAGQRADDVVHLGPPRVGGHGGEMSPSALYQAALPHRIP